jgi:hypothetical protein
LHPVVLHHVAMVKRVAGDWRVVGYGYSHEISGDAAIERLATSAYDEVRLVDGPRPNCPATAAARYALRIEDLFGRVRRIERERGASRPVLVRTKLMPPPPGEAPVREAGAAGAVAEVTKGEAVPQGHG